MSKYKTEFLLHIATHRRNRLKAAAAGRMNIRPLPTKPEEMTWRDYLVMLLHVGSELEHGLLVQYLYAAYSLGGENVPPEDQALVRKWQDLILTVAREEMGHLLTVQNLLCLVGGPVSFNREEFPWDTPFYPFPFKFEPLSKKSLAAYIFAEMPDNFDYLESHYADSVWGDRAKHFIDHDVPFIKETVKEWVKRGNAHPVGEVYHLIIDIISNPDLIPDSEFRPETYPLQASWDDWGRSYGPKPAPPGGDPPSMDNSKANVVIERAATRTEALYALREIMGQGEASALKPKQKKYVGAAEDSTPAEELSHFERFVELFQEFEKKEGHPGWNPVRNVPLNPTTTVANTPPDPRRQAFDPSPITAKASLKWANLFNVRYRILLTYLTHTFRLARVVSPDEPNVRGAVMHKIFGEMYNIKAIAGILVCMPLTDKANDPRRAGPPFQMPYTIELPLDEIDCWRLHRDIILNSLELCEVLLNPADDHLTTAPPAAESYLRALRNADQLAIVWIDTVLAGLRANGGKRP
jgi:Ferritin-like